MADDYSRRPPYPPTSLDERPSSYPPLPGEEEKPKMGSTTARLPGVFETFGDVPPLPPPSHHYPDPRDARLADPRSAGSYGGSPNGVNGYHAPPPPGQQAQQGPPPPGAHQRAPPSYLPPPPMQPSADPRTQVPADYYSVAAGASYPGYYRGPQYPVAIQQTAPRQRTSIACKYCRRRKIRCSGYAQGPPGKCTNCLKMNQACIFEPVSSTSSTAFVPLSAVAGGQLAPGTPLYGAYGQPLPPDVQLMPDVHNQVYPSMRSPAGSMPPSSPQDRLPPPFPSHRGPNGHASHQQQPPYAYPDDRRRPHEEDHAMRLPPPAPAASSGGAMSHDDNDSSRRRSPASTHSSEGMSQHYPPPPPPPGGYESRPSPPHRASPGAQPTGAGSQPAASVMSLGNLMDGAPPPPGPSKSADIDKNMLGRLDHRR